MRRMVTILKGLCQPPAPIKSFIQSGPFEFWRGHGPHHPKLKHPTRNMDWAAWIWPSSLSNSPPVSGSWTERTVVSFLSDRGEYHMWPGMAPMFPREPGWMRELDSCKSHLAPSFPAGDIELSSASAVGNTSLIMRNDPARGGIKVASLAPPWTFGRPYSVPHQYLALIDDTLFCFPPQPTSQPGAPFVFF